MGLTNNKWQDGFPETERYKIVKAAKITLSKPEGKIALDYLINERKFSEEVIDRFDMGYCPSDVNHEVRGRIVTPIYSTYGELVALSTRHLDKDHYQRFLHESFDKGSYLYGLYLAKEAIRRTNKVIIVEGECDVASMHTSGFEMTIGCCGSAFTLFQIALLSKYCTNFYLLFDGDQAGRDSTAKALKDYEKYNLKAYGLNFIPTYLPNGTDPNNLLIAHGKRNMVDKLRTAKEDCGFNI
jgi:DNA primase catalytic core